jgi:hypothetical protein
MGDGHDHNVGAAMSTIRPRNETARWAVIAGDAMLEGETRVGELTGISIGLPFVFGEGADAFRSALSDPPKAFADAAKTARRDPEECMACRARGEGYICPKCAREAAK